jgi:hypothetical protein
MKLIRFLDVRLRGLKTKMKKLLNNLHDYLQLKACYKTVFDLEKFNVQAVIADLEDFAGRNAAEYAGRPMDTHYMAYLLGRKSVVDHIYEMREITAQDVENEIEHGGSL